MYAAIFDWGAWTERESSQDTTKEGKGFDE